MSRSEAYTQRIRTRPYGPRELALDGVAAWFHGPFAVLTFTDSGTALTVRADLDAPSLGLDLLQFFTSVGNATAACLPRPERLVGGQLIGDDVPVLVHRFAVRPSAEGVSLSLRTSRLVVDVRLSTSDAERLAGEIRRWASAP
ncbi:hypothetical protein [Actinomadura chokoriensis]|uniref:Uncharacterized protein n=1 Tax=Actinomadura chokoriensis TaxID=454156 RepID=A0ABV4QSS5_9ACTN